MEDKIVSATEQKIDEILNQDINANNIEHLYKLTKIRHMAKEDENMRYSDYGRRYEPYGNYNGNEYNAYSARGYDRKYRGHEHLDRMADHYGR